MTPPGNLEFEVLELPQGYSEKDTALAAERKKNLRACKRL